jgi:hypothetical protein
MSTTTGGPSVESSATDAAAVNPVITKLDGWIFRMNAVCGPTAAA